MLVLLMAEPMHAQSFEVLGGYRTDVPDPPFTRMLAVGGSANSLRSPGGAGDASADGSVVFGAIQTLEGQLPVVLDGDSLYVVGPRSTQLDYPGRLGDFTTYGGLSSDGTTLIGVEVGESTLLNFVLWKWRTGEVQRAPVPSEYGDTIEHVMVSADGSIIGAEFRDRATNERVVVRLVDGLVESVFRDFASSAMSDDGTTFVGFDRPSSGGSQAALVSDAGRVLAGPEGASSSTFRAISSDGSTAVGDAFFIDPFGDQGLIWTNGATQLLSPASDLPPRPGNASVNLGSVNTAGTLAVGEQATTSGDSPVLWRRGQGLDVLATALVNDYGLDLLGFQDDPGDRSDFVVRFVTAGDVVFGTGRLEGQNFVPWRAILTPVFAVQAPVEDEIVPPDETYTVRFTAPGIETVDLYLVANAQDADGARTLLAEDVPIADGTYEWEVPEDLLSPSTYLIAVDADDPAEEVVSERFRVRPPYRLSRVVGTPARPEYELFRFSRNAFSFAQDDAVLWPRAYWDRLKNAYDDNVSGFDPLIPPIGAVRYDEEYFYARTAAAHPTWETFVRAFGMAGTYASTETIELSGLTIHQVNPNAASAWYALSGTGLLEEEAGYNGACYGFALAVLAGFGSPEAFIARWLPNTGQRTLADVPLTDEVRDAIHSLWVYGGDRRVERSAIADLATDLVTPRDVLAQLKRRLQSDVRDLDRVLVFQGVYRNADETVGRSAHAVAPIDLLDVIDLGGGSEIGEEGDGLYWLPVVDPNYDVNADPNSAIAFVEIDSTASTWGHLELRDGALFETEWGRGNAKGLYLSGLATDALDTARPPWPVAFEAAAAAPVTASHPVPASRRADELIVRIVAGDSGLSGPTGEVSYRNGTLTETLPASAALFPITGRPARPYAYVALQGRYTVDLAPGPAGRSRLTVGDRRTLAIERLDGGAAGPADLFDVGGDTLRVASGQDGLLRFDARLSVGTDAGAVVRTFAADSLQAASGVSVGVSALADSTGFRLGSDSEVTYDLALGQAGPGGRRSFYHANVTLPAGASHTVQPDWTALDNATLTVAVDLNGDGEPDETFELANEGFPVADGDEASALPDVFSVAAYPNPARGTATIDIALPEAAGVRAEVFDLLGRRVTLLHDGLLAAGTHPLTLDAARLSAGVYVVRAVTPDATLTKRLTVVR
ncbi:MAG: T9SS type A sorting domain-containing protein [Bacteroidota bacterium]